MKISILLVVAMAFMLFSCGGSEDTKATGETTNSEPEKEEVYDPMKDLGVGPITKVELGEEIDLKMAKTGEEVFTKMCTACHKVDKKFIGPAPKGIMEKRSPERIMNMILNPEKMIKENDLTNGEFYLDTIFNHLKNKSAIFNVDEYYSWGTPAELKKYNNEV